MCKISALMLIKQMEEKGDASLVAFFKAQGEEFNGLEIDYFILKQFSTA